MSKTIMDYIRMQQALASGDSITKEEFTRVRNNGTPEEIAEAVERMEAAGGYDNLE